MLRLNHEKSQEPETSRLSTCFHVSPCFCPRVSMFLHESRLFVGVTCGGGVADALDKFGHLTAMIAAKINKDDGEIFKKCVVTAIRTE